jgi:hypothetical protein
MRLHHALQDHQASSGQRIYDMDILKSLQLEYIQRQEELTTAYSQAIKYLTRTRERDSASKAQGLLYEMIQRTHYTSQKNPTLHKEYDHAHWLPHIQQVIRDIENIEKSSFHIPTTTQSTSGDEEEQTHNNQHDHTIDTTYSLDYSPAPPIHKDFHNVLYAWANSKAKKKGFMAQDLLFNMTRLTQTLLHEKPQIRPLLLPDTKALTLAIQCFATSTCTYTLLFNHFIYPGHFNNVVRLGLYFLYIPRSTKFSKSLGNTSNPSGALTIL